MPRVDSAIERNTKGLEGIGRDSKGLEGTRRDRKRKREGDERLLHLCPVSMPTTGAVIGSLIGLDAADRVR